MNAREIIQALRDGGTRVELTPDDRIQLTGSPASAALKAQVREQRDGVVAELKKQGSIEARVPGEAEVVPWQDKEPDLPMDRELELFSKVLGKGFAVDVWLARRADEYEKKGWKRINCEVAASVDLLWWRNSQKMV